MGAARVVCVQLGEPFANRERRTEVKVGPAQPITLRPREIHQPPQILRPLDAAACLRRHQRHLMQLLVDERHRDDQRIGARRRVEGVDDVVDNVLVPHEHELPI